METNKTASFVCLLNLGTTSPEGGYPFILDGSSCQIADVLEISRIATEHGYVVSY